MTALRISLDDKYTSEEGTFLLTGTQALVRLPLDQIRADRRAGHNTGGFISGYRGSPLGGYDQQLTRAKRFLDEHNIHFQPGVNEDLAATAVWGSQQFHLRPGAHVDGAFGIWYGKTPGVDRSGDAFKHANMAGTAPLGGVVAISGDDPQAKSSTLACQSEFAFMSAEIPVLAPSSVQDLLDLGLHAIALSRFSGSWVGVAATSDVVDGSATINIDPARMKILLPEDNGEARHTSARLLSLAGRHETEHQLRLVRLPLVRAYARLNRINRVMIDSGKPCLGVAVNGKNWQAMLDALRLLGIDDAEADRLGLRIMKVAMPWPLDMTNMREFADGLERILVIEAKRTLIETQICEALYNIPDGNRPFIYGKTDEHDETLLPVTGDMHAENIAPALYRMLPKELRNERMAAAIHELEERAAKGETLATPSPRTPYFCSGCPHNSSTVVPEGSIALAGIGCHVMAQSMHGHSAEASTHMGAEGVTWIGQAPFTQNSHIFVNLGDGTYYHSGILAIRAAVAAGVNITYKILYNDAVAMTGGQPVDGPISVADIARQIAAEGVGRIEVVAEEPERHSPHTLPPGAAIHSREELDRVQRDLRKVEGVSVLIYDQTCAAEKRRRRKRGEYAIPRKRLFINDRVCEGCGDCSVQSNCISVEPLETGYGVKRRINQSTCNMDFSCAKGFCPSFVEVEDAALPAPATPRQTLIAAASDLPVPATELAADEFKILFAGVGGMGVTTVSAILAMATHLDGKQAAALDITGLAQKGGAVLSHLSIAPAGAPEPLAKIAPGRADTLIAGDLIVAAGGDSLAMCNPERTRAISDFDFAPTAEFVMHGTQNFRLSAPELRLRKSVNELSSHHTGRIAQKLIGDQLYSNMILTGIAFQQGAIPISLTAIEQAIRLNGVAVEANLAAFHTGRLAFGKPEALPRDPDDTDHPDETLEQLVARLATELTAYADDAYAERFRHLVARSQEAEEQLTSGQQSDGGLPFTHAVAENFYKLMAYKDEYEVARLYTDAGFRKKLASAFGGYRKIRIQLAPPMISQIDPATGRPKKRSFGPWIFHAFGVLARMKGLRGTRFDPFGWTEERKMERRLIDDYESLISRVLASLNADCMKQALALARLPADIRGYGPVKLASIKEADLRRVAMLDAFEKASHSPGQHDLPMIAAE
ncbi:MAG: indolepyruvate ferredoxin oxidoreductase family protein [Hyphomicrobiales bacterium]|nr:indolepyruvate ferredoxin oxidoreductase family protein [Hyphomicrobiales bacterium]